MSGQAVVQVEDLDVYYGTSQILFGVGLSVQQGETMALLGRNGAGKSTTMKAIMGLAPARRGKVTLRGCVVSGLKPHHIARAGLGFVPEDRQIFPDHTVEDNLVIGQKKGAEGQDEWSIRRVYEVFPLLEPLRYRIAGRLSGRRTADARHRAHADGQSGAAVARRAERGALRRSSCSGSASCYGSCAGLVRRF